MNELIGKTLDRFQILDFLKVGSSWIVYLGYDPKFQRYITIKRLQDRFVDNVDLQEKILRAARSAIRLRHPGLARIFDLGQIENWFYLICEHIPGVDLRHLMDMLRQSERKVGLVEAALITKEIALAIEYARGRGFRLPKIQINDVMLKAYKEGDPIPEEPALPYQPVLIDLGLASEAAGESNEIGGNPLTGLVNILFELTTGFPPGDRRGMPPKLLRDLMRQAFATDPEERISSAGEFAVALEKLIPELQSLDSSPVAGNIITPLFAVHQQQVAALPLRAPFLEAEATPQQPVAPSLNLHELRLRILDVDHSVRFFPLSGSTITIGRSSECDIVLNQSEVSRQHAQILFDGRQFRVTDLGGANGTFIGENRLLAHVPQIWNPGDVLRIGGALLQIDQQTTETKGETIAAAVGSIKPPALKVNEGAIALAVDQVNLAVTPGQLTRLILSLTNQGLMEEDFQLSVTGLPGEWFSLSDEWIHLEPGKNVSVVLTVNIPKVPEAKAGRKSLLIQVRSRSAPAVPLEARINLTIAAFSEVRWEIQPSQVVVGQPIQVVIENLGNVSQSYEVRCLNPEHKLLFTPPVSRSVVPQGKRAVLKFMPASRSLHLFGEAQRMTGLIQLVTPDQKTENRTVTILQPAILPIWALLGLTGMVMLGLILGAVLLGGFFFSGFQRNQATLTAESALSVMVEQTEQARQATAQFFAGANEATLQAATATAGWLDGDNDRDGLSNRDELERGTLPDERDTDQDGVSDGEEVARGLNPLNMDTDGDGLKDGEEIARSLNPLERDTDKDGIMDGVDPDPGKVPTSTVTLTPVASPTSTITPTGTLPATPTASPTATFTQLVNPLPVITGVSPNSKPIGSDSFLLTVNGSGFINGSQVRWNGSPRNTTFQDSNTLLALIPASDLTTAGSFEITVSNPPPGGGVSGAKNFLVANPSPVVSSLNPSSRTVYDPQFTLQVFGANFLSSSKVFWGNSPRTTTFVNANQLSVEILASDLLSAGTVSVSVVNPQPGGGSAALDFTINNPVPTITEINPTQTNTTTSDLTLNVSGTNFVANSTVIWDENNVETNLATTFINSQSLTAIIPGSLLQEEKNNVKITVFNSTPGGGESNFVFFSVQANPPNMAAVLPHLKRFSFDGTYHR